MNASLGSSPSYTWRSIFQSLEFIKSRTHWRVGNGRLIHIWEDKWLLTPSTFKFISPPREFGDFPMVSSLIDQETKWWKHNVVRTLFFPFEADTILKIPLSQNLLADFLFGLGTKEGCALSKVQTSLLLSFRPIRIWGNAPQGTQIVSFGRICGN